MKSVVIYDSQYGNTRALAEVIAAELETAGPVQIENAHTGTVDLPSDLVLLVVGGPTQAHGMTRPLRTQLDSLTSHRLEGVTAATFDTRARGPRFFTGAASQGIARRLERKGAKLALEPESFQVDGKEGPLTKGELERARAWARDLLARVGLTPAGAAVT
jgi:flavodoxin